MFIACTPMGNARERVKRGQRKWWMPSPARGLPDCEAREVPSPRNGIGERISRAFTRGRRSDPSALNGRGISAFDRGQRGVLQPLGSAQGLNQRLRPWLFLQLMSATLKARPFLRQEGPAGVPEVLC